MNQRDIYEYLRRHGPSTVPEITVALGCDSASGRNTMHHKVAQLRTWNMVEIVGVKGADGRHPTNVWAAVSCDDRA